LAEVLGRNQGPTKIDSCYIDNFVLANGLRGNSRLQSLSPRLSHNVEVGHREGLAIASALRENKGLVDLDLSSCGSSVDDEAWGAICDSLETHPTLEILNLPPVGGMALLTPTVLKFRILIPYLETNRFRPHLLAIQKTRPIPYRAKVLGQALLAVRTDPNRVWMLLSGNPEVVLPSGTSVEAATTTADASANGPN
jgi:hypothetical protein